MSRKWKKRIAIGLACLGVLAVGGIAVGRYAQGSALRGFTDGRLEAADYWDDKPAILSAGIYAQRRPTTSPEPPRYSPDSSRTAHGSVQPWS